MKRQSKTTISVVIPAHNEADWLGGCLERLMQQTRPPDEIIVVNNHSTDATTAVARSFGSVRVLTESHVGIVYARNHGFAEAKSDIIARLDADARPSLDWLAAVEKHMARSKCDALTGAIHDLPLPGFSGWLRELLAHRFNRRLSGMTMIFGANMAIRRSVWQVIRSELCERTDIHEDLDLAIHLHQGGYKTCYFRDVVMDAASRRYSQSPGSFYRYLMMWPRTFQSHGLPWRRLQLLMYGLFAGQLLSWPIFWLRSRRQKLV